MIPVTCGIIFKNDKILMSKRHKKKREFPGYWEFPGGKCNTNESKKDCITREIKEELNVDIQFIEIISTKKKFINKYNIYYCVCNVINDNMIKKNNEISEYRYFNINDINTLKLLPYDYRMINIIKNYLIKN